MDEKYILTIDLGTSGPKVGIFDSKGRTQSIAVEETQLIVGDGGLAEQSPADWWQAICKASAKALKSFPLGAEKISAIGVTTLWSGTVAVDKDHNPLGNCLMWMDTRGARYIREITGGFPSIEGYGVLQLMEWVNITGGIPSLSGKDPIAHILYLKNERPDIYRDAWKFLEPKDYINLVLTGRAAAGFDSIAAHWLCDTRNIDKIDYHSGLLSRSGITREKLPDLCLSTEILGELKAKPASDLGLPAGIPVVCGTPDIHSACIGSGAVRDYEGHLYIGTSSWISAHVPFRKTDVMHKIATLPSAIPGRYFIANEQETSGESLRFLINNIFFADDEFKTVKPNNIYELCNQIASRVPPGSQGLIFTPWLFGERTPVENATIRGGFHNLSLHHTRADMIRSVFEGVAFNLRWLLKYVEEFQGRPFQYLNFIGGGARSELWCQILADVLQRPIRPVNEPVEANARGVALLTSVSMGYTTFDKISDDIGIDRTFTPQKSNESLYNDMFKEFLNIYKNDSEIHARMNKGNH